MSDPERYFSEDNPPSLHPWHVVRHLLSSPSLVLAQFSSRAEAEAHLQFLRRAKPTASYDVVFDELAPTHDP